MEFYFARFNDQIIGYVKLNYFDSQTVFQGNNAAELERIYVLSRYHRRGIGKALLEYAINIARSKHLDSLWLSVWEYNYKAIDFYQCNGLTQFAMQNYEIAGEKQTDLLMRIPLTI